MIDNGALHVESFDILLMTFETAVREQDRIISLPWHVFVVDEGNEAQFSSSDYLVTGAHSGSFLVCSVAHRLKNEAAGVTTAMRSFSSQFRLLLTGTPVQNNLRELWALLNFLQPDLFSSAAEFDAIFNPDTLSKKSGDHASALQCLHRMLRPFTLRRLKTQVLYLPPKEKHLTYAALTETQRELYIKTLNQDQEVRMGTTVDRGRLMNMMMQLRKVANHPWLFKSAHDPSVLLDGEQRMSACGKMMKLDCLLKDLKRTERRVLIFSQMTRMLNILEDHLIWRGYNYCRIDGKTTSADREKQIKAFNREESQYFVFLLSTRAGGTGINLHTADTVILYDSDWNPQMDQQAMDRAHRLGQKQRVDVHRFITKDTVEVKMLKCAEMKLHLDAMVIQQGRGHQSWIPMDNLTASELTSVIQYGIDKICRPSETVINSISEEKGGIKDQDNDSEVLGQTEDAEQDSLGTSSKPVVSISSARKKRDSSDVVGNTVSESPEELEVTKKKART